MSGFYEDHWERRRVYIRATEMRIWGGDPSFTDNDALGRAGFLFPSPRAKPSWEPPFNTVLRLLLLGTHDPNSTLYCLGGLEDIVKIIYQEVKKSLVNSLEMTTPACEIGVRTHGRFNFDEMEPEGPNIGFAVVNTNIKFPKQTGIKINMMPFIYGKPLPRPYRAYQHLVDSLPVSARDIGKTFYLTIHESTPMKGESQRRPGLHIEAPGARTCGESRFEPGMEHNWGIGMITSGDQYEGGIYMANSVDDTCQIWDALVDKSSGVVDKYGGIEPMRSLLGPGRMLKAGEMVWFTDRTPHESVPLKEARPRTFFRVVTSEISVWYAAHSTPNPDGVPPSCPTIMHHNKFEEEEDENDVDLKALDLTHGHKTEEARH